MPSALVAMAAGLAIVAPLVLAQTGNCVIEADGTHPAVDLNALHKMNEDYKIASPSSDSYVYHFNICGQTIFQDATCGQGATVCEVQDNTALDVYGYLDTTHLEWNDQSYLVLTQQGMAECPFNKEKPYVSKIYFLCSHEQEVLTVRTEAYYQCLLELEYHTPLACGGNTVHYKCDDAAHQCVRDDTGTGHDSYASCAATCHPPPPPPPPPGTNAYHCASDFTCQLHAQGPFKSADDCSRMCSPFFSKFSCYNSQCVRDSRGSMTADQCRGNCGDNPTNDRWACVNGVCTEDDQGPFWSEQACEASCSSVLYSCENGVCVAGSTGVADKSICEAVCTASAVNGTATASRTLRGRVYDQ